MKKCNSNCKTVGGYVVYYTPKKSPSPLGLGWCVNCGPVGERRTGYDGNLWVRTSSGTSIQWKRVKFRFNPIIEMVIIENCLNDTVKKSKNRSLSNRKKTPKKKKIKP